MIFDDIRTLRTINNAPNPNIIKIFFYIAFHQPQDGIRGYKIEKSQLQYDLKLGKSTFFNSLRWLEENLVVNELKLVLESDFMVNPYIVMNNGDRDARIDEWRRRINLEDARIRKNKERRRREQLKKKNQQ
ncbi:MAG: hypothetical protein IKN16_03680 [Selenomonadaceae bacterium]|nr:hypothetical protein [Selenomonadaceae bacterium]MBR6887527.1 hypothetical protein [Selenomonadaceae bacterium]